MGASKESMHAAMEKRIERIKALHDYQAGNELTIEHTVNRMRGDSSPETIAKTLKEMEDRGLLSAGIIVRGNARIRTYVRRSHGLRMKWRTVSNEALGIKENCGIQGAYP